VRHPDSDDLALLALGEDAGPDVAAHLANCPSCAAEVASLRRVVLVGRSVTSADVPSAPPSRVWDRIQEELGLGAAHEPPGGTPTTAMAPPGTAQAPPAPAGPPDGAAVVHLTSARGAARRRRLSVGWLAAAAAVGLVFGAVGGTWWAGSRTTEATPTVLAEADLQPLPGWDAAGVAVLETQPDGTRVVVVDVAGDLGTDGYREVWLLAPDVSGMISLGLLEGTEGRFVLPAGIDVGSFPVVDVSEEPFDGDASHSGNSIVRGTLEA
jgi:hypothetical protein